ACRREETCRRPKAGSGPNRRRELKGWSQDEHLHRLRGCPQDQFPFHKDEPTLQLSAQRRLAVRCVPLSAAPSGCIVRLLRGPAAASCSWPALANVSLGRAEAPCV